MSIGPFQINEDCFLEISKYLNFKDILRLSLTRKHFLNVIKSWVIGRLEFDLPSAAEIYSTSGVFACFGENMTKLRLTFQHDDEFWSILSLMEQYCSNKQLKQLHLQFPSGRFIFYYVLTLDLCALFENLECLTISAESQVDFFDNECINYILYCSKNLRKLAFNKVHLQYDSLYIPADLTELCFRGSAMISTEGIENCLMRTHKLKKLVFEKLRHDQRSELKISSVFNFITRRLPNLEYLDLRIYPSKSLIMDYNHLDLVP